MHVTVLFQNFIKGITYFAHENDESNPRPIYHRLYSCGLQTPADYRLGNLVCLSSLSKEEVNRRRALIERCYIERLIYNELYKHESLHFPCTGIQELSQDKGHIFRLDLTRQDFETCFPNTRILVHVEYHDGLPFKLVIQRTSKTTSPITLTYTKTINISASGQHFCFWP